MRNRRKVVLAVGTAAVTAGAMAAVLVYLMIKRPQWREHVVEVSRHLLNAAEGLIKRG